MLCIAPLPASHLHAQANAAGAPASAAQPQQAPTYQTFVRRVVLDVVATDAKGAPVPGLKASDFSVKEDSAPQKVLSFDASSFTPGMEYTPPVLPPQPPGSYINLPSTPETGPLYVLFYDMVNMEAPDQMMSPDDHSTQPYARDQLIKFIESKPEGTRFCIFVRSDGLYLVQGFTSDKKLLEAALDPRHPRPHVPPIFLNAANYGRGDQLSALHMLHTIAEFLDGLPGRKNIIWFSSMFPLPVFAGDAAAPQYVDESRQMLDLIAHDQIAIYPVDARGVALHDSHAQTTVAEHSDNLTTPSGTQSGGAQDPNTPPPTSTAGYMDGPSAVAVSYDTMDLIAEQTGGRAFYGDNRLAMQLAKATEDGGSFYTLTYAPTDRNYNGALRHIVVTVDKPGVHLSYRRQYYAAPDAPAGDQPKDTLVTDASIPSAEMPELNDRLAADIQFGAPETHALVFIVKARNDGPPHIGTPEEMATLATEPAYFRSRHRSAVAKPLPPVPLQTAVFSFFIPTRQFPAAGLPALELAAAAYNANGTLMNGVVSQSAPQAQATASQNGQPRFYSMEERIKVPAGATTVRVAVRDTATDRVGAMDIALPLPPTAGRGH